MDKIRVTSITSIFSNFSGIPPAVLQAAAYRGTLFHTYAAAYAEQMFIGAVPEIISGFFESFKGWFDAYVDHVFWTEMELVDDELDIVGHADAGIRLVDGRNVVVDWKTPVGNLNQNLSWGPQLASYFSMAKRCCEEKYDCPMVVQPRKDGRAARGTTIEQLEIDRYWTLFVSALNIYRYKHR